jgi:hypothetical protein
MPSSVKWVLYKTKWVDMFECSVDEEKYIRLYTSTGVQLCGWDIDTEFYKTLKPFPLYRSLVLILLFPSRHFSLHGTKQWLYWSSNRPAELLRVIIGLLSFSMPFLAYFSFSFMIIFSKFFSECFYRNTINCHEFSHFSWHLYFHRVFSRTIIFHLFLIQ